MAKDQFFFVGQLVSVTW